MQRMGTIHLPHIIVGRKKLDNNRPKAWEIVPGIEPDLSSNQLFFPFLPESKDFFLSATFTVSIYIEEAIKNFSLLLALV